MTLTIAPARRLLREGVSLYWDSGLANEVPALAWFLLASLVPLALGTTALAAILLGDYAKAQVLAERISRVLPPDAHDEIVQLILRTQRNSPLLIAGSIAGMLWTSSGAVGVLDRSLSNLLGRPGKGFVRGKLRNIAVAGALAVLVVLMVIAASAGTGVVQRLGLDPLITRVSVPVISVALTATVCAGVYRVLGGDGLEWRSAFVGGLVGGVLLDVTPTLAGYYLRFVAGRTPEAVFLLLAGVLATCYLAALALLLGAGIAVRAQVGRGRTGVSSPSGSVT